MSNYNLSCIYCTFYTYIRVNSALYYWRTYGASICLQYVTQLRFSFFSAVWRIMKLRHSVICCIHRCVSSCFQHYITTYEFLWRFKWSRSSSLIYNECDWRLRFGGRKFWFRQFEDCFSVKIHHFLTFKSLLKLKGLVIISFDLFWIIIAFDFIGFCNVNIFER